MRLPTFAFVQHSVAHFGCRFVRRLTSTRLYSRERPLGYPFFRKAFPKQLFAQPLYAVLY